MIGPHCTVRRQQLDIGLTLLPESREGSGHLTRDSLVREVTWLILLRLYTAWNTSRAAKTEQKRKEEKGEERSEIISTVGKWGPRNGVDEWK